MNDWEFLVAKARPLGVLVSNGIKRATFPVSPGSKVRVASKEKLEKFLGLDLEKGLFLGSIDNHGVDVRLSLSKLLQKHLAILAMSGAGKSYTVSVLLEELLDRKKEFGRVAVVLFDVHGEYLNFGEPVKPGIDAVDYSDRVRVIKACDIRIAVSNLNADFVSSMVGKLSGPQKRHLARVFAKLKQEMRDGLGPFDFEAVKNEVVSDDSVGESTKNALVGMIYGLEDLNVFGKIDYPNILDFVQPGMLTIVDLSSVVSMKKKQIIVNYFNTKMFFDRRSKRIPPFVCVLEEAHQFVPEGAARENALSKQIIETVAREGRKFGACICLVSQRPIKLSTTVLSQCNTHLIMRITNPYDLNHIGQSSEGLDQKSLDAITSLRVGEGLLVGEAVNYPCFFKVRKRKSQDSKHQVSLEQEAFGFEKDLEQRDKDTDAFI